MKEEFANSKVLAGIKKTRSLYLIEQGASLSWSRGRFLVTRKSEQRLSVPVSQVDQILVFGNIKITTPCLHKCLSRNIPILLASASGTCRGLLSAWGAGPPQRRLLQLEASKDKKYCLTIAKALIQAKVDNSLVVLTRYSRNRDVPAFQLAADKLKSTGRSIDKASDLSTLLGVEGSAARAYYQAWKHSFDDIWKFKGRKKRPSPDPINALLSFGYSILYQNALSLLSARGLLIKLGFLHQVRSGHEVLASDMIEPFRAPIVDSLVLKLIFNSRIQPEQFTFEADQHHSCILPKPVVKLFLQELETKLSSSIAYQRDETTVSYRACIDRQAQSLVDNFTDAERFVPFSLRR